VEHGGTQLAKYMGPTWVFHGQREEGTIWPICSPCGPYGQNGMGFDQLGTICFNLYSFISITINNE
jgi:hypothetical protein